MSSFPEEEISKARFLAKQGATDQARQLYRIVLDKDPHNKPAQDELAALDLRSAQFKALTALYRKGDLAAVLENGEALARQYPKSVFLYNILGTANAGLRRWDAAIACFAKALEIRPDLAESHNNLGKVLGETSRPDEAIACFQKALKINPGYGDAHYSLGIVLHAAGRLDEAIACFTRAVQIEPNAAELNSRLGAALCDAGRHRESIVYFKRSLQINPKVAGTHIYLSIALNRLARFSEEIDALTELLKIDPILADVRGQKLFLQAIICDWASRSQDAETFSTLGLYGAALRPFVMLSLEDDLARHKARSQLFVDQRYNQPQLSPIAVPAVKPERLRIGYFSADFSNHAVMYQLVRLLELHDRSQFQVYAHSFGPPVDDATRARAEAAVDVFRDVRALGAREIAELARQDGIDIAIDLLGHTKNARTEIFARRAAPVQISYLGYPGTMGASFIDYIIADKILIPEESRIHYFEKVIYLPYNHMATDNTRVISDRTVTRAEVGLPENGFVFCLSTGPPDSGTPPPQSPSARPWYIKVLSILSRSARMAAPS